MFNLAKIKDTVPIHPTQFGILPADAIADEINKKYADKVLQDVGLCISLFDILECSEGKVRFGDGCLWHKVTFRMVVFRPFVGEILVAQVKSSNEDGIQVSLGFFDDVYVPVEYLPQPSAFDETERLHFWVSTVSDPPITPLDVPTDERFYIDLAQPIRLRVESDEFYEEEPGPPMKTDKEEEVPTEKRAPYTITCSALSPGLGLTAWWDDETQTGTEDDVDVTRNNDTL